MRAAAAIVPGLLAAAIAVAAQKVQDGSPPPAQLQNVPANLTARIAGTIEKVDGRMITVNAAQGQVTFAIQADTAIMTRKPARLADIRPGTFLGTTAVEKNGRLESTEIHIFPESMRGAGEGHRPMQAPNTTMTNGNVSMTNGAASIGNGGVMKVAYQGGEQEIHVPPGVEITLIEPLDAAVLKSGTSITGTVRQNPDGSATATLITIVQ